MSTALYPSLDPDGWLSAPMDVADKLLSDFFNSNYSQSDLYLGNVSSFGYIMQVTKGDIDACKDMLRQTLKTYFSRYFPSVSVDIETEPTTVPSSKTTLNIYMSFTDVDGKTYQIGKMLHTEGTKISKIVKLNNEGTPI